MTETPNPTIAEIRAQRNLHTGRVSIAQDEIVRRLQQLLPGVIADFNAVENLPVGRGVQMLKSIEAAPAILSDGFLGQDAAGKGFVSMSVKTFALSAGATYKNEIEVTISIIDAPIQSANQVRFSWERIELIREVLFPLMSNCVDARGRACWKILEPSGYARLDAEIKKWSGVAGTWRLLQVPNQVTFPVPV